jgi:predicted esterase
MWSWQGKYETVNAAVDQMRRHGANGIETDRGILIGFSLGALAAMDIAHRGDGPWDKLILIGAKVYPNATLLKRAGVRRVLLASGDRDMMRWHMTEQARRLDRQGVPSTFMSLGDVGHWFAPDMDTWMTGALQWVQEEGPETTEPLIASAPQPPETTEAAEGTEGWCGGRPCVSRLPLRIPGSLFRVLSS